MTNTRTRFPADSRAHERDHTALDAELGCSRCRSRRTASTRPTATRHSSLSAAAMRSTRSGIDSCAVFRSGAMPSIAMPTRSLSILNYGDGFSVNVRCSALVPAIDRAGVVRGLGHCAAHCGNGCDTGGGEHWFTVRGVLSSIRLCPPRRDALKLAFRRPVSVKFSVPLTRENNGASAN